MNEEKREREFKFPTKKVTDHDKFEFERAMSTAALIWEEWKNEFISVARAEDEVAGELNKCIAKMATIRKDEVRKLVLDKLEAKLVLIANSQQFIKFAMQVIVKCPGKKRFSKKAKPCGYYGPVFVRRDHWDEKKCRAKCPGCGGLIHQSMMAKVEQPRIKPEESK